MAFTYDPLCPTNRDTVRLLCTDTDATYPLFQDGEIDRYLTLMGNNVLRAAAMALLTLGAQENMLMKRIRLLDLQTDGPAQAAEFRALAEAYQEKANLIEAQDPDGTWDWAEMVLDPFTAREKRDKEALRG